MGTDNLAEHLVTERGDGGLARRQTMLGQQFGNGAVRGTLLAQFSDDLFRREQVVEFLGPARCKLRDCLADCRWIKGGHTRGRNL